MRKKTFLNILILLLLILSNSSCMTIIAIATGQEPEVVQAAMEGDSKLLGFGFKAGSKLIEDKSPGAAKAFDAMSDIAYGATGQSYEQHMREQYNLKEDEPLPKHLQESEWSWDSYPITFVNNTNHTILIKGFGVSEELPPISHSTSKYFSSIEIKNPGFNEPWPPTELKLENRNRYRQARDYELIYDKNIIDMNEVTDKDGWKRKINFTAKAGGAYYGNDYFYDKDEEYIENHLVNDTQTENDSESETPETQVAEISGESQASNATAPDSNENPGYFQVTNYSVPMINNFENGEYYVQLASFRSTELVRSEITKIDKRFPVVIMKTIVNIRGEDTLVHRILVGPVSYSESRALLQQFKATYKDAFIWTGR